MEVSPRLTAFGHNPKYSTGIFPLTDGRERNSEEVRVLLSEIYSVGLRVSGHSCVNASSA